MNKHPDEDPDSIGHLDFDIDSGDLDSGDLSVPSKYPVLETHIHPVLDRDRETKDKQDIPSKAAERLSFAPEYFGVSNGVTEEEAGKAAEKFETWVENSLQQRASEVKGYNAGPRHPSPEEMFKGVKSDENPYPTQFITRGRDFDDGSALTVTLIRRDQGIGDAHDDLRGSTTGVLVKLSEGPIGERLIRYRIAGDPPALRREEQNEIFTAGGRTIPRMSDEELAKRSAEGFGDQACGLKELAGLMYLFDDEELPKTENFMTHEFRQP